MKYPQKTMCQISKLVVNYWKDYPSLLGSGIDKDVWLTNSIQIKIILEIKCKRPIVKKKKMIKEKSYNKYVTLVRCIKGLYTKIKSISTYQKLV